MKWYKLVPNERHYTMFDESYGPEEPHVCYICGEYESFDEDAVLPQRQWHVYVPLDPDEQVVFDLDPHTLWRRR